MNIVDIIALAIILLGALVGYKKGAIKSLVQLIGLVAIIIVAYQFKGVLADILIDKLPFFNFPGALNGLYSMNIILYEGLAFVVIYILLYCVLNILINLSGFLERLVRMTIILALPSKILGGILGAIESVVFVFLASFVMLQFAPTQGLIMDSNITRGIVERTPVVKNVFAPAIATAENAYNTIETLKISGKVDEANLEIIRALLRYGITDSSVVNECIENGKLRMQNVTVYTVD